MKTFAKAYRSLCALQRQGAGPWQRNRLSNGKGFPGGEHSMKVDTFCLVPVKVTRILHSFSFPPSPELSSCTSSQAILRIINW